MTLPEISSLVGPVALDTETYDPKLLTHGPGFLRKWGSYMIGFSYANNGTYGYVPTRHSHGNYEGEWKTWLKNLCDDPSRTLIFAHAKYDLEVLWSEGIAVKAKIVDIQTLDALINENHEQFSLKAIAARRGFPSKGSDEIEAALIERGFSIRNKADWTKLKDLPVELVAKYAELDASLTLGIYKQQCEEIARDGLEKVAELESQLIPILWEMRRKGVRVSLGAAEVANHEIFERSQDILNEIVRSTESVSPFTPKSLANWVRNLGFEPPKTALYRDSISNDWLMAQGNEHLTHMAEYRKMEKIRRDFIEALVIDNSIGDRVHPSWFSTRGGSFLSGGDYNGTRSGRIACIDPNLTQIPARHPVYGPLVRGLFLPEIGERWGKFDYSSQEPRITVHYAYLLGMPGAKEIKALYDSDPHTDFHQATANMIFEYTGMKVTRAQAKTVNLGLAYGMGKAKLARGLGIEVEATEELLKAYHRTLAFMRGLLLYCSDRANKVGYVKTVLGRRRHYDEWEKADTRGTKWEIPIKNEKDAREKWGLIKRAGTYKALNAIVQGSAAEQTKTAMIQLYDKGLVPMAQIYDELDYSISSDEEANVIKTTMENARFFEVPHVVDMQLSESWLAK